MSSCYKCGSHSNLSIKSQNKKTGYKLLICKSCRNSQMALYNKNQPPKVWEPSDDWNLRAYLRVRELSERLS